MFHQGEMTRDALAQLLLCYIGTAADIIEFFDSFKVISFIFFVFKDFFTSGPKSEHQHNIMPGCHVYLVIITPTVCNHYSPSKGVEMYPNIHHKLIIIY